VQEEVSKFVVTDDLADAAFAALKTTNSKVTAEEIRVITSMAIRPKLSSTDMTTILENVAGLLVTD
jgi:hypothetical protein